jgi:calcineurin-like phosphoesterase family protein
MLKLRTQENDIWFSSDFHYNHKNICSGITSWRLSDGTIPVNKVRDFKTLELMNETIVNNINNVVKQNDILFHLGDWSFSGFESISSLYDRLVCKNIHLILGNHDKMIEENRNNIQSLFSSVSQYLEVMIDEYTYVLSHYPFSSWNGLNKGWIHLHGHTHLNDKMKFGLGKRMDVGLDGNNLKPYNIKYDIVPLMNERTIKSELPFDHHTDEMKINMNN